MPRLQNEMKRSDPLEGLNLQELEARLSEMDVVCATDRDAVGRNRSLVRRADVSPDGLQNADGLEAGSNETRAPSLNRRAFLRNGTALTTGLTLAGPLQALMARRANGDSTSIANPYGEPVPTADEATGLELLQLPPGFRYRSFGWIGDPMLDGTPTPGKHDGMAVIRQYGPYAILSRNHEVGESAAFSSSFQYSPNGGGGCTNLLVNAKTGKLVTSYTTLTGTIRNCAGGPTPWGTWLTCEETFNFSNNESQRHGYVFEVGAFGSIPHPLASMGRFSHEAVAIDPKSGIVYETEDGPTIGPFSEPPASATVPADVASGFYRFIPRFGSFLRFGGQLQMAKVKGVDNFDFRQAACDGTTYELEWVDIDNPDPDPSVGEDSVFNQGYLKGGALFQRLEGCWYGDKRIYVVSTNGGPPAGDSGNGEGIIFEYKPSSSKKKGGTLEVIFASPAAATLENPDNLTVTPSGAIMLCEDNSDGAPTNAAERLVGITKKGQAFTFAVNNVNFTASGLGPYTRPESGMTFTSNNLQTEWAGATFSYDGKWLFVNIQDPGITFAITGPWKKGPF